MNENELQRQPDNLKLTAREDDEIEIDLGELLRYYLRRWWLLLLGGLAGILLAGVITFVLVEPTYEASSMIYMRGAGTAITSIQDLQIGAELTNDYEVIFKSRPILEEVVDKLKLDMNYKKLRDMVELSNPTDTRILKVAVKEHDAKQACEIVNALVDSSMDRVKEIDAKEPYLIEEAVVDMDPVSPSPVKNLAIGLVLGIALVGGILTILFITNDRIRSSEDVESILGVPVLCLIPESQSCKYEKKRKHRKRRAA